MDAKKQHLIILAGIAGSGKSTWAEHYARENGCHIVSTDKQREYLYGDASILGDWSEVLSAARMMVHTHLEMQRKVIVDATNLTAESRQVWIDMANKFGVPYRIHVVRCSPLRAWLNQFKRTRRVPFKVILRHWRLLDI